MLSSISWSEFIISVIVISFIYYVFVILRYYPAEFKEFISSRGKAGFNKSRSSTLVSQSHSGQNAPEDTSLDEENDEEFLEVETLIGEIKKVIVDNSERDLVSQEFKQYLHEVLRNYPNIQESPLREAINELIMSECQKYSGVTLSESELDGLWVSSV